MRFIQRTHYVNLDTGNSLDSYVKEVEAKTAQLPTAYRPRIIDVYVPVSGKNNHTRMQVDELRFD